MIKNSVIALVATAALAGVTLPAMAASGPTFDSNREDYVMAQLHQQGINAVAVEEWGSYLRAFVVGADGHQSMEFFNPVTLAPVSR